MRFGPPDVPRCFQYARSIFMVRVDGMYSVIERRVMMQDLQGLINDSLV